VKWTEPCSIAQDIQEAFGVDAVKPKSSTFLQ